VSKTHLEPNQRIDYIDNIRIFLTITVIFHHLTITYGAPGGWYYHEIETSQLDLLSMVILVLIAAANQAYFMGFFFFLSGYFSAKSLTSKQTSSFIIQRLTRLGLPILIFVYFLSPLLRLTLQALYYQRPFNFSQLKTIYEQLRFGYELGPMWFVLLLLILTIGLIPLLKENKFNRAFPTKPTRLNILFIAGLIGGITFLVRIDLPVGYVFQPLNLQVPHLTQYLVMFILGSITFHQGWLERISEIYTTFWSYILIILILIMPAIFVLSGGLEGDVTPALGGFHWQSLFYSLWEQFFCITMVIQLLYIFRIKFNTSSRLSRELALSSYAAYILHPLVLVGVTTLIHSIKLHPLLKIGFSIMPVLVLCFLVAGLARRLPGLKLIL
jgi:hypothetical protein